MNHGNVQGAAIFSSVLYMEMASEDPTGRMTGVLLVARLCLHEVLGERPNAKPLTESVSPCRDALDAASVLYNQVDEGVHRLVMLSNKRIQELELVMEFEKVEECFKEVRPACQFQ